MNKQIITFDANEQSLVKTGGVDKYSSNKVSYIEAHFNLGENWSGYDSVRAVWFTWYECISTVLDTEGICIVPYEVLKRTEKVMVNLVGSISEDDVLTDRITTYPIKALEVDADAKVCGSNTQPITPSEYEQFVEAVKADADRAEEAKEDARGFASSAEISAQIASISETNASTSEDNAKASELNAETYKNQAQTYAQNANNSAISAENAKDEAEDARDTILGMRAEATTLPEGSSATASYNDGVMSFGIPKGDKGDKGNTGETGAPAGFGTVSATVDSSVGTPSVEVTASGADTAKNFAFAFHNLKGQKGDKGDTGEVSQAEFDAAITDVKSELNDTCVKIQSRKNLFDASNTKNILDGAYFYYDSGVRYSNAQYSAVMIPLISGKKLTLNVQYAHVAFFSDYFDMSSIVVSTAPGSFVSGGSASKDCIGLPIPANANWVIVSTYTVNLPTLQVEYGEEKTPYEPYMAGLRKDIIFDFDRIMDGKMPLRVGTNLYNYKAEGQLEGYYISAVTGKKASNANYMISIIPVNGGEYINCNEGYCHYVCCSDYPDIFDLEVGGRVIDDIVTAYSGGSGNFRQLLPASVKYLVLSHTIANKANLQVQYGAGVTSYESYLTGIYKNDIIDEQKTLTLTLDINGSGDFTELKDVISYINANVDTTHYNTIVNVLAGTYDAKTEYGDSWDEDDSNFVGWLLPRNTHLIGKGKHRSDVIFNCVTDTSAPYISALNFTDSNYLENLTVYGENCRYAVHDDAGNYDYANKYGNKSGAKNVDFIGKNNSYGYVYGEGTRGGADKHFIDCRFINKTDARCYSVHDKATATESTKSERHVFDRCEFIGGTVTSAQAQEAVRICPAIGGVEQTIEFNGCVINRALYISSQWTGGDSATTVFNIVGSGNTKNIPYLYYNDFCKQSAPKFADDTIAAFNGTNSTLSAGSYVKIDTDGFIAGSASDYDGIVLSDISAGAYGYARAKA